MAQQKATNTRTKKSADNKKGAASKSARSKTAKKTTAEDKLARVEKYTVKPEFWDNILDSLPPWGDEIAAILLIVFGVVSFLSLLNVSSDATISAAWSNALTSLFGYGGVLISAGILLLGVIILLPKLGLVIQFPTRRIVALEVAFLSSLALLHLSTGAVELRAIARAGQGGGQVGWALSIVVTTLAGSTSAVVFYSILLGVSLAVVVGVRSRHVSGLLRRAGAGLRAFGERMVARAAAAREKRKTAQPPEREERPSVATQTEDGAPPMPTPATGRSPANYVMRIRPDIAKLPPSLRPDLALDDDEPETDAEAVSDDATDDTPEIDPAEHPLFTPRESLIDPNTVGVLKEDTDKGKSKKSKKNSGQLVVERPDGRLKRYFTVDAMREPRYTSKRSMELPELELLQDIELNPPNEQEINNNVVLIENTLLEFDIDVDVVDVKVGPTVTQYAVQPFQEKKDGAGEAVLSRTRVSKIVSVQRDLALALSAKRLRLETPVPGHSYIGIEVPNQSPSVVALRSVIESRSYHEASLKNKSPLLIPLGRDVSGMPVAVDIGQMPHLLIAGTTGSGKSVAMAAIATALVLNNMPDQVKLIMLDPKMVELSRFNGLPHLVGPVETDQERIIGVLRWCTREMDRRYRLLEEHAARNIDTFNSRLGRRRKDEYMPYIVIMVDEVGDLMMTRPEETEKTITRLAQMARAVGMHLIVATQRPSVDVITGLIKANFPTRISFAVASGTDSRVILDTIGAETLLGRGDMLYLASDASGPRRVQGCYVSDDEVRQVVSYWRKWRDEQVTAGNLEKITIGPWERGLTRREFLAETDPMLEQAIELVIETGEASASLIQRRLGLGYPRAARILDMLEELGIISSAKGGGRSREVLIRQGNDPFKEMIEKRMKGQ